MNAHRWTAQFYQQWSPFFGGRWNWIDFTFLALDVEWADYDSPHEIEIHLAVLGLHVTFIRVNQAKCDALAATITRLRSCSPPSNAADARKDDGR